jgi:hypothetical protein
VTGPGADPPSFDRPAAGPPPARVGLVAGGVFAVAVLVRLWRFRQCLWADEMESLLRYVAGPWRGVVAPGAGQYVPNDHVLYAVLAKLCLTLGAGGRLDRPGVAASLIRVPSLLAGSLVPIALAWPLRRTAPVAALLLAVIVAVHPWSVAQSDEARGYALMVLLGVVATHLLPGRDRRWPLGYAVALALALYTIPIALYVLVGHGAVTVLWRRERLRAWCRGAAMAVVLAGILYLPMLGGLADYYRHPLAGPDDNADFANQLPRFALAGQYLPATYDPAAHVPDPWVGVGYWLVPVGLMVAGTAVARRRRELWAATAALATVTAVGAAVPILAPAAGQVRFVPWCGLWLCAAVVALLLWAGERAGRLAAATATMAVVGWMVWVDLRMPPEQPVREAIALADRLAPPGAPVLVAYLSAGESARLYGGVATRHTVAAADAPPAVAAAEAWSLRTTGHLPWLVVSFEFFLRDASPPAWQSLQARYRLVARLPGRTSPVAVYAPRG